MIAFVKDTMIYITVLVAVILSPIKLGGYRHIFAAVYALVANFVTKRAASSETRPLCFSLSLRRESER
jgi:hypothetical protein